MTMTDNTTLPADWAIEHALKEGEYVFTSVREVKEFPRRYATIVAFARYIEKHEKPPVDQWTMQARELAAGVSEVVREGDGLDEYYRAGSYDKDPEVQAIAAALRAAYEKGKAE